MKPGLLVSLLLLLALTGCASVGPQAGERQTVVVFSASSLTNAFNELAAAFEAQNDGVDIILNYAGSSQLAAQLAEGGAADVFAPAGDAQMQAVIDNGRIDPGTAVQFVSNRLTIVVPADNPAGIQSLEDLAQPDVQLILAVQGVPVRQYTDELVTALDPAFQAGFYGNLVSEEDNVRQVLAKVALGEADAGLVYTSDVTADMAAQVQQISIPDEQNVSAGYPIAMPNDAPNPELAQQFIDFVLSSTGQGILAKWGFGPPSIQANDR